MSVVQLDSELDSPPDSATETPASAAPLKQTPLHSLHVARGGRMVPFAGYEMPVQYADGILAEHNHVRSAAGLFDVSHMGQAFLVGADHETVARALETLVPGDIVGLAPGRQRYTQLLDDNGGILDDLMVTRSADPQEDGVLFLVVNAATKEADYAHIAAKLPAGIKLLRADHRALLAVQGPTAVQAVGRHCPKPWGCRSWARSRPASMASSATSAVPVTPARTATRFPARRRACARSPSGCCPSRASS